MKNLSLCLLLSLLWGCSQMEQEDLSRSGEVRFTAVSLNPFTVDMPNARTEAASSWRHIFKDQAKLEVTDKNTGQTYSMDYNPNKTGEGFSFSLPYGSYTYFTEVEGGEFSRNLPFRIEGEFLLNAKSLVLTLQATTDYGLITVKNEYLGSLKIRDGFRFYDMALLEDGSHYYLYARKGLKPTLEINDIYQNQLIERTVEVQDYTHYSFFLKLAPVTGNASFLELAIGGFGYFEVTITLGEAEAGTFTDPRDGQVYKTVLMGIHTWMAENLNYETEKSWCYDEDPDNCAKYGRLYVINSALTACPEGWHLPSKAEWGVLAHYLGGWEVAGGKMKSNTEWDSPNTGATNESGFSALPGGDGFYYDAESISFHSRGSRGFWWASDRLYVPDEGWSSYHTYLFSGDEKLFWQRIGYLSFGEEINSCRCIKD